MPFIMQLSWFDNVIPKIDIKKLIYKGVAIKVANFGCKYMLL